MITKRKKWALHALLVVLSVALFVIASSLAAFGFEYKIIIGSALYFFITYFSLKHQTTFKPRSLFILIIFPILLALIVFNILQYQSAAISAPSNLFLLLSAAFGYFFLQKKNFLWPLILLLLLGSWHYKGNRMFLNYINYGTLTSQVNESIPTANMYTAQGKLVRPNSSKTVILDFWNSKCGYCYAQFPLVESIYKKMDTSMFELNVVNIPFKKETKEDNYSLLSGYKYKFPQLFAENSGVADSFSINGYPTTVVLKQNKIIFRGDFREALKFVGIE